jgi:hypothetical protein
MLAWRDLAMSQGQGFGAALRGHGGPFVHDGDKPFEPAQYSQACPQGQNSGGPTNLVTGRRRRTRSIHGSWLFLDVDPGDVVLDEAPARHLDQGGGDHEQDRRRGRSEGGYPEAPSASSWMTPVFLRRREPAPW